MTDQEQERRKAERLAAFELTLRKLSIDQLREVLEIADRLYQEHQRRAELERGRE